MQKRLHLNQRYAKLLGLMGLWFFLGGGGFSFVFNQPLFGTLFLIMAVTIVVIMIDGRLLRERDCYMFEIVFLWLGVLALVTMLVVLIVVRFFPRSFAPYIFIYASGLVIMSFISGLEVRKSLGAN